MKGVDFRVNWANDLAANSRYLVSTGDPEVHGALLGNIVLGLGIGIVTDNVIGLVSSSGVGPRYTLGLSGKGSNSKLLTSKQTLHPNEIYFMQSSIRNTTGEFTVLGNAEALKAGTLQPEILRINVWMDSNGKI